MTRILKKTLDLRTLLFKQKIEEKQKTFE